MKLYFSTKQIPQLASLSLPDRIAAMDKAAAKMSVPEKTLLNVLKLLVFVPAFAFILRTATDWTSLLWALGVFILYPVFVKPMQYSICAKHLPANITKE